MPENDVTEVARKRVADDKELADRSRKEYEERSKGKPTPTQEENDLAAHGAHIVEHEDDGSGPDPNQQPRQKQSEAGKPGGGDYQTRAARPAPQPQRTVPRSGE